MGSPGRRGINPREGRRGRARADGVEGRGEMTMNQVIHGDITQVSDREVRVLHVKVRGPAVDWWGTGTSLPLRVCVEGVACVRGAPDEVINSAINDHKVGKREAVSGVALAESLPFLTMKSPQGSGNAVSFCNAALVGGVQGDGNLRLNQVEDLGGTKGGANEMLERVRGGARRTSRREGRVGRRDRGIREGGSVEGGSVGRKRERGVIKVKWERHTVRKRRSQ
jgi:hypothetical protein